MTQGPEIIIGHGQSLAYNPKDNKFWMWRDLEKKSGGWKDPLGSVLQRVDPTTLNVDHVTTFTMKEYNGAKLGGGHNLTFDKNGNGYFVTIGTTKDKKGKTYKNVEKIYRFSIKSGKKLSVRLVQQILYAPNKTNLQAIGYDPALNRLALLADDSIQYIPVAKLQGKKGKIKAGDISYAKYATKRECESIAFDSNGTPYLFVNRYPEILRGTL
jgi:hypothetical protein